MDETSLREMLDRAVAAEPPLGPIVDHALRTGSRIRRRQQVYRLAGCAAVAAVIGASVPVVRGLHAAGPPATTQPSQSASTSPLLKHGSNVGFVTTDSGLVPIYPSTNTAGPLISTGISTGTGWTVLGVSPDDGSVYFLSESSSSGTVMRIDPRGREIGKPITLGSRASTGDGYAQAFAFAGSNVYVLSSGGVVPISTRTGVAGTLIPVRGYPEALIASLSGKTVYVLSMDGSGKTNIVTPIDTATGKAGTQIRAGRPDAFESEPLAITASTLFVVNTGSNSVTPIDLASGQPAAPIPVGYYPTAIISSPDGQTVWVASAKTITPIDTRSRVPGKAIWISTGSEAIAISPDGRTVWTASAAWAAVTPIDTATRKAGWPIRVKGHPVWIAPTPDGRYVYVLSDDMVIPVNVLTRKAGPPIRLGRYGHLLAFVP